MRVVFLFAIWLAAWLGVVMVAYGGDAVPVPADDRDPLVGYSGPIRSGPKGTLILREVYDLNGRRIALEEYTDAPARTAPAQTPKPKAEARTETKPPPYMFFQNKWWKWDGVRYLFCEECEGLPGPEVSTTRSVSQANPTTQGTIVRVVAVPSTTYQASTPINPTITYAVSAGSPGVIGNG